MKRPGKKEGFSLGYNCNRGKRRGETNFPNDLGSALPVGAGDIFDADLGMQI